MWLSRKGGMQYVDRGSVISWDYLTASFTQNNAWHNLDLSSKIPIGSKLVLLHILFRGTVIGNYFYFQNPDYPTGVNISAVQVQTVNVYEEGDRWIAPNALRLIAYISKAPTNTMSVCIRGWLL